MQGDNSSREPENYCIRRLEISDKHRGFIKLLKQLTTCNDVSDKEFDARFQELSSLGDDHVICVIEDAASGKIIATGSVFIEKKFIRSCGKVGHIEDVVVDSSARGLNLGKRVISFLMDHAQSVGCYKVILDCSMDNRAFYEKCGFKQKEVQMIGQYIASNGGVVAAEELAPYLDVEKREDAGDESFILPVLLRFDGQPEIDDEGNILYRFPSLQRTASSQRTGSKEYVSRKWTGWVGEVEKFFKERKWNFSKTSASERALVVGLGGLNLFGVIILGTMLKDYTVLPSGFLKFVADIFPLLQIYAGSFFAIPLIRWFLVRRRNAEIEKRNRMRLQYARSLEIPDISLRRKARKPDGSQNKFGQLRSGGGSHRPRRQPIATRQVGPRASQEAERI